MSDEPRICAVCGEPFTRRKGESRPRYAARRFCSLYCATRPGAEYRPPRRRTPGESGYMGVYLSEAGTWAVRADLGWGERAWTYFPTARQAAHAFDSLVRYYVGADAPINFRRATPKTIDQVRREARAARADCSSRYRGVTLERATGLWMAQVYVPELRRQVHVGRYADEREAALAYDAEARRLLGERAKLNFP